MTSYSDGSSAAWISASSGRMLSCSLRTGTTIDNCTGRRLKSAIIPLASGIMRPAAERCVPLIGDQAQLNTTALAPETVRALFLLWRQHMNAPAKQFTDFKVADLKLADWGRREIAI